MSKKICLTALLLSVCLLSGCSGNSGSDTHSADNTQSETVLLDGIINIFSSLLYHNTSVNQVCLI